MSITSINTSPPLRPSSTGATTGAPVQPVEAPAPLAPAVRIDVRQPEPSRAQESDEVKTVEEAPLPEAAAVDRRLSIDRDTKSLVFQLLDQKSGDVVVQIPDVVVLKNRAYAEAMAARAQKAERPLDKTA